MSAQVPRGALRSEFDGRAHANRFDGSLPPRAESVCDAATEFLDTPAPIAGVALDLCSAQSAR